MNAALARAAIEALATRDFESLFGTSPVLVLAPHPDDELLGCGGAIAEGCARRHAMHVAILTDGSMSHPNSSTWPAERLRRTREGEARAATAILGVPPDNLLFLGQKDSCAPHEGAAFDAVLQRLCDEIRSRGIGTICASWIGDPHGDHGAAAKLATAASRRTGVGHLAYPVWAWTTPDDASLPEVRGGGRLDVARHLSIKRRAIAAHATQYSGMIHDDPTGFRLSSAFLAHFDRPWEAFLDPA